MKTLKNLMHDTKLIDTKLTTHRMLNEYKNGIHFDDEIAEEYITSTTHDLVRKLHNMFNIEVIPDATWLNVNLDKEESRIIICRSFSLGKQTDSFDDLFDKLLEIIDDECRYDLIVKIYLRYFWVFQNLDGPEICVNLGTSPKCDMFLI